MLKLRFFVFLIISLLYFQAGFSQSGKTDSLINALETIKTDSQYLEVCVKIAELNAESDSSIFWEYNRKAIKFAKETGFVFGQARAYLNLGRYYSSKTEFDSAIYYFEQADEFAQKHQLKQTRVAALGNSGNIYCYRGDYEKGLNLFMDVLDIMHELENKNGIATATNNIANVYYLIGEFDNALKYYKDAKQLYNELDNDIGKAMTQANIGIIYFENGDSRKALEHYHKAEELQVKLPNKKQTAGLFSNIAQAYLETEDYHNSEKYLKKVVKLADQLGDKHLKAHNYISLGEFYTKLGRYKKAEEYLDTAIAVSRENKLLRAEEQAYSQRSKLDSVRNDFKSALKYYQKMTRLSDSIFSKEKTEHLAQLRTQYETEKNIRENKILKQQKTIDNEKMHRQLILNYAFAGGIVLLLFTVGTVWASRRRLRKAHRSLQNLHAQLNQQKEEIQTQADNLTDANKAILEQKSEIEKNHEHIKSSINYAGRIQKAALPDTQILKEAFSDYFIFYKPRDIVSGDFYWVKKLKNYVFVAAADCTGHGVPGAFVSMLGISMLNDIVSENKLQDTDKILNELRTRIKNSLHQKGGRFEQKDGMDISLCRIDRSNLELQYSGAHSPIYIVRSEDKTVSLNRLKADRMPIGIHRREKNFSAQKFQTRKGDTLYLFSDGYQDQFGGKYAEKFKTKRFQSLIISMHRKNMDEQARILEKEYRTWKGDIRQLDDILVTGLRI